MVDCKFELQVAESSVKHGNARANAGDVNGARSFYERAAKKYEDLAAKVPERKAEFEQLAAQYRNLANNPGVAKPQPSGPTQAAKNNQPAEDNQPKEYPPASEEDRARALEEGMKELHDLVGIPGVKEKIDTLVAVKKIDKQMIAKGLEPQSTTQHLVFTGNPGTGKTTVARIIAKLYFGLGICKVNHCEETGRSKLVAGYQGQTAPLVRETIDKALGGVLFVDEAYALKHDDRDSFGQEAIDELLVGMENHRDDLIVIAAGYANSMENFLEANEGLRSRFKNFIDFEDYSDEDLVKIFKMMCKKSKYTYSPEGLAILKKTVEVERSMVEPHQFGNSRTLRNIFEDIIETQKVRLSKLSNPSLEQLTTFEPDDFIAVLKNRLEKKKKRLGAAEDLDALLSGSSVSSFPRQELKKEPAPVEAPKNSAENDSPIPSVNLSPLSKNKEYVLPPMDLLVDIPEQNEEKEKNRQELAKVAALVENKLNDFGIEVKCENIVVGPSVSRLECRLISKTPLSKIESLENDISMTLKRRVRLLLPIRGKDLIGIEVPNSFRSTIGLKSALLKAPENPNKITFLVGEDIEGNVKYAEFKSLPHMLVAGQTGSGKSVFLQCLINSVLFRYTPNQVKFVLIDFKRVEFFNYNGLPNIVGGKVIDEHKDALDALKALCKEMDDRYAIIANDPSGVDSIEEYNAKVEPNKRLPLIVCIIDEYADMIGSSYKKEFNANVTRLVQKARAAAIHIIISTQRPSTDVLDGIIKANLPTKIALSVANHIDSSNIINASGAQNLTGMGDMLMAQLGVMDRYQSAYISKQEVRAVINYLKSRNN